MLRRRGVKIIRIDRGEIPSWVDDYVAGNENEESLKQHVSNKLWLREKYDLTISNNSTIDDLEEKIYEMIEN